MRELCVVVLNYGTPALTIASAESALADMTGIDGEVVVVDNKSPDDSLSRLRHWRDRREADRIDIIAAPSNGGFASGNNIGMRAREAEFYLLLNSDTLVRSGAIPRLLAAMRADPRLGIAGPQIVDADGAPAVTRFRHPTPLGEFIEATGADAVHRLFRSRVVPILDGEETAPGWIGFPAVMLRKQMIDEIGLLDESYFMYFEDADYCRRAGKAGWRVGRCAAAVVEHFHGGSSNIEAARQKLGRLPQYYYASRARYFKSWYGSTGLVHANLLWHLGRAVNALRVLTLRRPKPTNRARWRDIWSMEKFAHPGESRDPARAGGALEE